MPQPREVLGQGPDHDRLPELACPRGVELHARRHGRGRDAGVVDVIVEDQAARRRVLDPDPAIREELGEAEAPQELIEPALPDAPGVAPPRHVTRDPEVVPSAPASARVPIREEEGEPLRDVHEEATPPVLHVGRRAVEVGPAHVDGVLDSTDGRRHGRDEAVRDVVRAVRVRDDSGRGVGLVGRSDAELVEHVRVPRVAPGVELAREYAHDVPNADARLSIPRTVHAHLLVGREAPSLERFDAGDLLSDGRAGA